MEQYDSLCTAMSGAFQDEAFLRKLHCPQADAAALFDGADWAGLLAPLLPMAARLDCGRVLAVFRTSRDRIAHDP